MNWEEPCLFPVHKVAGGLRMKGLGGEDRFLVSGGERGLFTVNKREVRIGE